MSSTRNINTPGNYCLQQQQFKNSSIYTLYPNSQYGNAYDTKLPGNGLNPAQIPSDQMSRNAVEIESSLFGINSTNLVSPQPEVKPELINLKSANIFQSAPVFVPEPLVIEKNQRPFPSP